jgi:hypothetical protein
MRVVNTTAAYSIYYLATNFQEYTLHILTFLR